MKTTRKVDKREQHVKKKLTAAILMLLISCIMTVTSTYAWFTLSTAPEVTGIQTTIGGNGNLEIALATTDTWANPGSILTVDGSNNSQVTDTNTTWGNLVDLSDEKYGLENIVLNPSELNVTDGKVSLASGMLSIPEYGPDGRITKLNSDRTLAGIYNGTKFTTTGNGVRAIGTPTGMSDRELGYRNALNSIDSNINSGKTAIGNSLNEKDGSALASIAIKHALATDGTDTYSAADVTSIGNLITGLRESVDYIEAALRSVIDGYVASLQGQTYFPTDEEYLVIKALIKSLDIDAVTVTDNKLQFTYTFGEQTKEEEFPISSSLATAIQKYQTTSGKVKSAEDAYEDLLKITMPDTGYTWGQISACMTCLINTTGVSVNGYSVSEIQDNLSEFANSALANGVIVELGAGSGVYYEVAELIGNFVSKITISGVDYNGVELNNLPATISTVCPDEALLSVEADNVEAAGSPANNTATEDKQITDFYGYIIDFFVRTNAADATLMLSDAQQRIYSDATDVRTMGKGSTMTFSSTNVNFTVDDMKGLMNAIRIVFTDGEGSVIANAKLDVDNAEQNGTELSARIKVIKTETTEGENPVTTTTLVDEITKLEKNATTKLCVIVYLDGNSVQNKDVANAYESMTGTLNLQFKTNTELKAMEYSDLHVKGESDSSGDESGSGEANN